ncbi:MAG: Ig domain protein group 2 domain protein [Eubacterium sp.]|jgi:hypothetical protein|nr:Ig domain protein group 2 domain protein [Eubacterium sp.]
MYQIKSNKFLKIGMCLLLAVALLFSTGLFTTPINAAVKPSIEAKKTIGTGSIVGNYDYYSREDGKYVLSVSDPVKKATYTFTSSNAKVVAVKANGTSAYLTGLKAGTATITCNQKLNGKTTKVGTCTVTVKNATVIQDDIPVLPLGSSNASEPLVMPNRNNDATYTYTSNSKNFTVKETISKFDGMSFVKQSFNAAAAGTYTVTVKETYNKVTRTVGTIKYTVKKATVVPEGKIDLGSSTWALEFTENYRTDVDYLFIFDNNIVEGSVQNSTVYLKGKAVGTTDLKIYENTKTPDESKLIGTCKLTVKEVVLEGLTVDFNETEASLGDSPVDAYVYKTPENAPGTITVTSSDAKVATVSAPDEEGLFQITPVGAGTTTITITCGDVTKTQDFTVNSDEE